MSKDPDVKKQLKDAQQRAKASLKALQSELKGSAQATPARYSTWPIGCAVRVAINDPAHFEGGNMEAEGLHATLVCYNIDANTFEVKFEDGSTRVVPAKRVTRVRARERAMAQAKSTGQTTTGGYGASPAPRVGDGAGLDMGTKDVGIPASAGGYGTYQASRLPSYRPPLAPHDEMTPSALFAPEPTMLGRVQ